MVSNVLFFAAVSVALTSRVSAHAGIWDPSMYGFNLSQAEMWFRPQDPLMNLTFDGWWMHNHTNYPPHPNDIKQMPVGGTTMFEVACDKGVTSYYTSNSGGDIRDLSNPDYPCPHQPVEQFHTNGSDYLGGCALSVAYKSDIHEVVPEDLVIFSVNHTCVWNLHTYFEIPKAMPPCPNGKCICAWHWVHRFGYGPGQVYMNGFQCDFAGATSTTPLAKPQVPRRCGAEADRNLAARPWDCTYGAKAPIFWKQIEGNNMFEEEVDTPYYHELYNYRNGAQTDIFMDSNVVTPLPPGSASPSMSPHAQATVDAKVTPVPTTSASSSPSLDTANQSAPDGMSPSHTYTSESKPVDQSTSSYTPTTIADAKVTPVTVPTTSASSSPSLATANQSAPKEMSSSPTHTSGSESSSKPIDQSTSSHAPTTIVDAKVTPVPSTTSESTSSSPSVETTHQSPPSASEMSTSPAHTSESKPSQSDASRCHHPDPHPHHYKHRPKSSRTPRDYYGGDDGEINSTERSVRRAWLRHRRAIGKRHV